MLRIALFLLSPFAKVVTLGFALLNIARLRDVIKEAWLVGLTGTPPEGFNG